MEIRHQRTYVAAVLAVYRPALVALALTLTLESVDDLPIAVGPTMIIALVDAVVFSDRRRLDVLIDESELADHRVQSELMNAGTRRVYEHGAGTMQHVARRNLFAPDLQAVVQGTGTLRRYSLMDREDSPDRHVDTEVRRSVEGIVQEHILPRIHFRRDRNRIQILFRSDHTKQARPSQYLAHGVVCQNVELLLSLAGRIFTFACADDVIQSCSPHITRDDFSDQGYVDQQAGKLTRRLWMLFLPLEKEPFDRNNGFISHNNLSDRLIASPCTDSK